MYIYVHQLTYMIMMSQIFHEAMPVEWILP